MPVHVASMVICYYLTSKHDRDETAVNDEFEDLLEGLMYVNIFCLFAQMLNRNMHTKEATVIELTQKLKDEHDEKKIKENVFKTSTAYNQIVKKEINTEIDINLEDDDMYGNDRPVDKISLAKQMIKHQAKYSSKWLSIIWNSSKLWLEELTLVIKNVIIELLSTIFTKKENTQEPYENLSSFHFVIRSMLALISTILYQYTIFRMIVILAYRPDNFVIDTGGEATKPALYMPQDQPTRPQDHEYDLGHSGLFASQETDTEDNT
jgi:hypothetical protein